MTVTTHASLDAFFHKVVTDALDSQGVKASEHTEFYLVDLLRKFAKDRITDEPLAVRLAELAQSSAKEQIATLKEVGDTSLYVTGMFVESFGRKLVNPNYYIGLGETAYRQLAARMADSPTFEEVYRELAEQFPRFVDVFRHIRERVNFSSGDIVQLYKQYLETRSDWIERRLRDAGILVGPDDTIH